MKQKLLLFAFSIISTMLFSQAQNMAFEDSRSNDGTLNFFYKNVVKTDASGNIYVAGATVNGTGTTDILLVKKNSSNVTLWTKTYNGAANFHDFATGLYIDGSGNVFITGAVTNNTVNLTQDAITIKYNSAGTQQWVSTYDGGVSGGASDLGKDLTINTSGVIFVTGATYNSSGNADMLTICYNSSGTQQWASKYNYTSNLDDGGVKLATKTNTAVTITGAVKHSANNYKVATIQYNASTGSTLSVNISTATSTSSVEIVSDMLTDASGNIYICGAITATAQGFNYYTAKLTNSLTVAWESTYDGASHLNDQAKGLKIDASNNVYVTGYSTSSTQGKDITTIKYNSSGTQQWVQSINSTTNGSDEGFDLEIDASSNIYVVGGIASDINQQDYYTVKYNSSGTKIWEIQSDGSHLNDQATNVALDSLNNVIVTGSAETAPNSYVYTTYKYVQKDVIIPTDFNGEALNQNYMFFANKGQIVDTSFASVSDVNFYTHCTKPSFYFKNHSQSFSFSKIDTVLATTDTIHRIDLNFTSCNETSKTYPMEQQEDGYLNYYMGYLAEKIVNVKGNKRLITPNLYNNIDLMTCSNNNGIKYYYIVKPGGDMRDIKLEFTGATSYSLNGTTNALSINSSIGSLTFDKPIAYQLTSANATVAVTSFSPTWTIDGASNKYKFNNGTYTSSLTLVIEVDQGNSAVTSVTTAPNIEWSTNFGSSGFDSGGTLINDAANNLYLIGNNSTASLPQGTGISFIYQATNKGLLDGYIAKFDQTGILKWRTYVGGSGHEQLWGIDIANGGAGDVFCVGTTQSATMQIVPKAGTSVNHATHASAGANKDGFIFQLNQSGTTCNWLTYFGGTGTDILSNCKFDPYGNLFIIGITASNNFTVVGTAPQYTCAYNDPNGTTDAYVIKLNNATFNVDWATYVNSTSTVTGCSTDGFNVLDFDTFTKDVFIGGSSSGSNYPILHSTGSTTLSAASNCLGDGIITRFSNAGQMLWSTYVPSNGTDDIDALKVTKGNLYVGGGTNSITSFPTLFSGLLYANTTKTVTTTGPYQESGFFLWFDNVNHIKHSTLIGGVGGDDDVTGIAIDAVDNIYLTGSTTSTSLDQPSSGNPGNTWSETNKGGNDQFIFTIKKGTTDVIWSTEVGGDGQDGSVVGVTIDGNNKLFISTTMQSTTLFPWHDGGGFPVHFQGALTGGQTDYDGCITRFKLSNINYVGIKEYNPIAEGVFLYPNPTQGSLTIRLTDVDQKKNFTIFNTMGQVISSGTLTSILTTINVANLAEGMYFMEITDKTTKATAKFIKQ